MVQGMIRIESQSIVMGSSENENFQYLMGFVYRVLWAVKAIVHFQLTPIIIWNYAPRYNCREYLYISGKDGFSYISLAFLKM